MEELESARRECDEAFAEFVKESAAATKHTLKATAARARWMLARAELHSQEQDLLAWPVNR